MTSSNELLARIESARLWGYFHKDWLLQMRLALRDQLPSEYRVFVESDAVLIAPDGFPMGTVMPDVSVGRSAIPLHKDGGGFPSKSATTALIEVEESCEVESQYSLIIRRSPEQVIVAVVELLSPSNKGIGNRLDRTKFIRKRVAYLDAGVNLLEIDALLEGDRDLPPALDRLKSLSRVAWTASYNDGRRRFRGWGWGLSDPLPSIDWQVDVDKTVLIELDKTCVAAR